MTYHTPASPERKHAQATANNPRAALLVFSPTSSTWSVDIRTADADLLALETCTIAIPRVKTNKESHFLADKDFLRRRTEKRAVVRIFIWYVT